jgi:lysophospholipase L1-like esterase
MKSVLKNIFALFVGCFIAFAILEVFLRAFNPIPERIKGGEIVLPRNQSYKISNTTMPQLDKTIVHTKNSLGFRGPDMPSNFENRLTVIVVGGSTSECYYLSDEKTWPYLLEQRLKSRFPGIWVNNAGLDGHSTYGNLILMDDYISKIKPKFVLFLIGINDIERGDLHNGYDNKMMKNDYINLLDFLSKKSEAINFAANLARAYKARARSIGYSAQDVRKMERLVLTQEFMDSRIKEQGPYLAAYKERVKALVKSAKGSGIEAVFITQPMLWGEAVDPATGVGLGEIKLPDNKNGMLYWKMLESYNDVTRMIAAEESVFVIDLAKEMPKDTKYFYDGMHFSNKGAEKVAEIIANAFSLYLENRNYN